MTETEQQIGSLYTSGTIWRPITFTVIYKFPKPPDPSVGRSQTPIKCIIADDSGLIILLLTPKRNDERTYNILQVGRFYTVLAGGFYCRKADSSYNHVVTHSKGLELWVSDEAKIVEEKNHRICNMTEIAKSPFNFNFTELSKLAKGTFDIIAKVKCQGAEEVCPKNDISFLPILLLDGSIGVNQAIKCRLQGEHCKLVINQGTILALHNTFVGSDGSDLVIYVNQRSAAFVVSSKDWEWILNDRQQQLKTDILNIQTTNEDLQSDEENQGTVVRDGNDRSNKCHSVEIESRPGCEETQRGLVTPTKRPRLETLEESITRKQTPSKMCNIQITSPGKKYINCSSISDLKSLLKGNNRLDIELTGVYALPDFIIRRYLGCAKCSKSLTVINGDYICHGKICSRESSAVNFRNDPGQRKSFYLLKNFKIKDMSDELQDSLVGYNQVLKEFIGKDADQFESDSSILEEFTELTNDQRLNIAVRATISLNSWDFTLERLSLSPPEDDDAEWGSPWPVVPEMEVKSVANNNNESAIRAFLARRTPFDISVLPSKQRPQNEEDEYVNSKLPHRGIALHISTSKDRTGSDTDERTFEELFKQLHYEVRTVVNIKAHELAQHIMECRDELIIRNHESFVLCISGHGLNNTISLADGALINIWTDIIYQFDDSNFPQFRGKPKIVLVNACQSFSPHQIQPFASPSSTPNHPDFLVFIATSPGYQSYRDPRIGTHFIRTLAYVMMHHAHDMEIKKLFYLVAKMLYVPDESAKQPPQLPEIRDFIFSKLFFFRP